MAYEKIKHVHELVSGIVGPDLTCVLTDLYFMGVFILEMTILLTLFLFAYAQEKTVLPSICILCVELTRLFLTIGFRSYVAPDLPYPQFTGCTYRHFEHVQFLILGATISCIASLISIGFILFKKWRKKKENNSII